MTNYTIRPADFSYPVNSDYTKTHPWDITQQGRTNAYADSLIAESLAIAGADINVFKMLGVHEQTKLLDLIGNGTAISGGDAQNYPASNAFTTQKQEWRSRQGGSAAIVASSYIGYDFGVKKVPTGRAQYGIPVNVRHHITTIKIKQSSDASMRVSTARVERSDDGKEWYGVAIIQLPDNDSLNTINFKQSVPSRFWRLRPQAFPGTDICKSWAISAFEMHDYAATALGNIQDKILLENRDRDYQQPPTLVKGYYDLQTATTDLTMFGQGTVVQYQIKIDFNTLVNLVGRPVVIGDILELPSETQYTPDLRPVKRYLEVSDVTWDPSSYTPGWMPTMLLITAVPAMATQETRDIFGDLAAKVDDSGLFDNDDGNSTNYQDYSAIDQAIAAEAKEQVPERGSEGSNTFREFTDAELTAAPALARMSFNRTGLYVEDAMPQNDAPFTRGDTFPAKPKDGDYFRMEYSGMAADVPARLYRYSGTKGRFLYLETDRRAEFNAQKATLEEYTTSPNKISAREVK
jgi:hypothetical protein